MPRQSPCLAPKLEFDTYIVLDEFDKVRIYREVDEAEADRRAGSSRMRPSRKQQVRR